MVDREEDEALEALFEASRAQTPAPSDDFLARLAAEADASVPVSERPVPTASPLFRNLKTWFAASGLTSAAVLGLWVGFVMPDMINTLSLTTEDSVGLYTFLPGADLTAPGFE